MADKFEKKLNDAIEEVVKGYKAAAKVAATKATEKTAEYIYNEALSCLESYYYSYTNVLHEPKRYERTNQLRNSFVKHSIVKSTAKNIVCEMGVIYDYTKLDGAYNRAHDESYKGNWTPPDSSWIIDNYLDGIHPTTNGATSSDDVVYTPVIGSRPSVRMSGVVGDKTFEGYAYKEFQSWFWQSLLEQTLNSIK
jgi:hypothetical protein